MFRRRKVSKALVVAVVIGLILALALGGGGCKKAPADEGTPPGDSGSGGSSGEGTGGTGDPSEGGLNFSEPGSGLPVTLPSGTLAFGLYRWSPSAPVETMTLCTVDADGQNLTQHAVLSPNERKLLLSPDGTKLATFNGGPNNYDSDLAFWVYDLAAGTLTKLPRPEGDPYPGYPGTFCWSPDSKYLDYTCSLVGTEDGDRLARAPVDGSAGGYANGLAVQAFQGDCMDALGTQDAVLYTDDDSVDGFSLHSYDFGNGGTKTILASGVNGQLSASPDGYRAAFLGFLGYGAETPLLSTIADLATGKLIRLPAYLSPYTIIDYVWSPNGDRVAVVWTNSGDGEKIGLSVYDLAGGEKCRTQPIEGWDSGCTTPVVWSPDGEALFVAAVENRDRVNVGAKNIYRVDASTGNYEAIFTSGEGEGIIGLMVTP